MEIIFTVLTGFIVLADTLSLHISLLESKYLNSKPEILVVDNFLNEIKKIFKLPTKLSDSERNLLEELAGHYSALGPQHHYHKSGLFSKLFGNK